MAENIIQKNEIYEGGNPFDEITKGLQDFLKILKDAKGELQAFANIRINNIKDVMKKDVISGEDYKKLNENLKELNNTKQQANTINDLYKQKEKEYNEIFAERQKMDNIYVKNLKDKEKAAKEFAKEEERIIKKQQSDLEALNKQRSAAFQKEFIEKERLQKQQKEEDDLRKKNVLTLTEQAKLLGILRKDYRNLTTEQNAHTDSTKKLLAQITALDSNLKKHNAVIGNYQINVGNYMSVWRNLGSVLATIGVGVGVGGVISLGKEVAKTLGEFEKFEAVLTTTLGSNSRAKKALEDISEFAAQTPFQIEELTNAFVKLANRGVELTIPQMRKLGDVAAALGKPFDQLNEAILDINNNKRWTEIGIKSETIGDKVRLTWKNISQTVDRTEKGVIKAIEAFGSMNGVVGQMAGISKTTAGQLSNLADNYTIMLKNIGESTKGFINNIVSFASSSVEALKNFFKVAESTKIKQEIEEVNVLVQLIKDNVNNVEKRNQLIDDLEGKYPNYFKNLKNEKDIIGAINIQLEKYNTLRGGDLAYNVYKETIADFNKKITELRQSEITIEKSLLAYEKGFSMNLVDWWQNMTGQTKDMLTVVRAEMKETEADFKNFQNQTMQAVMPIREILSKISGDILKRNMPKPASDEQIKAAKKFAEDQIKSLEQYYKMLTDLRKENEQFNTNEREKELNLEQINYTQRLNEYRKFIDEQKKYLSKEMIAELVKQEEVLDRINQKNIENINKKFDEQQIKDTFEIQKLEYEIYEKSAFEKLELEKNFMLKRLDFLKLGSKEYQIALLEIQKIENEIYKNSYEYKNNLITKEAAGERNLAIIKTQDTKKQNKELLQIEIETYEKRLKLAEDYFNNEALKTGDNAIIGAAIMNIKELQKNIAEAKKNLRFEDAEFGETDWFAKLFNVDAEKLDMFAESWNFMKDKVAESVSAMISSYQELTAAQVEAKEKEVEASEEKIETLNNELSNQLRLAELGLANNSEKINKEIELEKQRKAKLEAERNEAIKNKIATDKAILIGDSIVQASNLITATTKIWNVTSSILPPLGQILAIGAIGTMWTSFLVQKSMMMSAIESQKPKFAHGEVDIKGKSHREGGIDVEIEGGESVISKKGTQVNKAALQLANQGINIKEHFFNLGLQNVSNYNVNNSNKDLIKKHDEQINLLKKNNEILMKNNKFVIKNRIIDSEGNEIIYT